MENQDWKFVPVTSKQGKVLALDYLDQLSKNALFPIHRDEFEDLNEIFCFDFSFEEISSVQPKGEVVAYCYGSRHWMMTKAEFFKQF